MSGPIDVPFVKRGHTKFLQFNRVMLDKTVSEAGRRGVRHAEQHPHFIPRSPRGLAKSNQYKILRTRKGRLLRLQNPKRHAKWIEDGTKPHVIKPRRAKLLRFRAKSGALVFARKVNHPGTKPYRFLYGGARVAGRHMGRLLKVGMRRLAKRF